MRKLFSNMKNFKILPNLITWNLLTEFLLVEKKGQKFTFVSTKVEEVCYENSTIKTNIKEETFLKKWSMV